MLDSADLLSADNASRYFVQRNLIDSDQNVTIRELSGGVSNTVLEVRAGGKSFICKQSLRQLRVEQAWLADRGRILAESDALRLAGRLTPRHVPAVLDCDPARYTLSIERAPQAWGDWKNRLLAGHIDVHIAAALGKLLAHWQNATAGGTRLPDRLHDYGPFEQLRIDPYFRTAAGRLPDCAAEIEAVVGEMAGRRRCLTHGDFSPKNVLVGPDNQELWVIDFEVAHLGDPAFDVAFLVSHFLLKSLYRPRDAATFARCVIKFTDSWSKSISHDLHPSWPAISRQVGCLLLARVVGKSPVEYLDEPARQKATQLGLGLLSQPVMSAGQICMRRDELST